MLNSKFTIRQMTITALMVATLIVCSQIAFNLPGGIPVTMQTFGIALIGFLLGTKLGTIAVGVYLLIGLIGLPVFSNFGSGPAKLLGPTGGYLIGFLPMVLLIGLAIDLFNKNETSGRFVWLFVLPSIGLAACQLLCVVWLSVGTYMSFLAAAAVGSIPFIIKDIASVILGYFIAQILSKPLNKVLVKA